MSEKPPDFLEGLRKAAEDRKKRDAESREAAGERATLAEAEQRRWEKAYSEAKMALMPILAQVEMAGVKPGIEDVTGRGELPSLLVRLTGEAGQHTAWFQEVRVHKPVPLRGHGQAIRAAYFGGSSSGGYVTNEAAGMNVLWVLPDGTEPGNERLVACLMRVSGAADPESEARRMRVSVPADRQCPFGIDESDRLRDELASYVGTQHTVAFEFKDNLGDAFAEVLTYLYKGD